MFRLRRQTGAATVRAIKASCPTRRAVCLSTGDTGFSSAKTYDLEVWPPGQQPFVPFARGGLVHFVAPGFTYHAIRGNPRGLVSGTT